MPGELTEEETMLYRIYSTLNRKEFNQSRPKVTQMEDHLIRRHTRSPKGNRISGWRRAMLAVLGLAFSLAGCLPGGFESRSLATRPAPGSPVSPVLEQVDGPGTVVGETPGPVHLPVIERAPGTASPDPNDSQPEATAGEAPALVTQDLTNVRWGPGLQYEIMIELGPGTTAPVLGRNKDASWLAIPGAGDGAGPHGWVSASIVTLQGDVFSAPILPAPTQTLPVVQDPGSPPANACIASRPDGTQVNLHLGPGEHFNVVAVLGNWAEVLSTQQGWHQLLLGPGETAWAEGSIVELSGPCLPPPVDPCRANLPSDGQPINARLGPGEQFGFSGVMDRQAEVLGREGEWLHVQLGPGQTGWVPAIHVVLSGECEG
jgi:uncharacterized protein YraI